MFMSVNVVLGVFLLPAVKQPARHRSLTSADTAAIRATARDHVDDSGARWGVAICTSWLRAWTIAARRR